MLEVCFAFKREKCDALKDENCPGFEGCPFYKPKSVNDAEIEKYSKKNPARKPATEKEKAKMARLYVLGYSTRQIADITGFSTESVKKYLREVKDVKV